MGSLDLTKYENWSLDEWMAGERMHGQTDKRSKCKNILEKCL